MKRAFLYLVMFIALAFVLTGCPNSISNPKDIIFPDKNVSYTGQVEPFLKLTCAFASCHGVSGKGNIYLDDYFRIINSPGLVIAGNPDGSLLIQVLEDSIPHFTYFERSNITENHKKGMRLWVKEGAKL